jgi:ketosteroid isomerase-like protein
MGGDNAAAVRDAYAAIGRRDYPALLSLLDPGVELRDSDLPGGGTYVRHRGITQYLDETLAGFEEHRLRVVRLVETDDRVVAGG